tara:strand:+ start:19121 stop:20032 length:912 start_codon:yes stop_codon:yes gene_type:complete
MSFVYVLECKGKYKIGISASPEHRITSLQIGNPFLISLVGKIRLNNDKEAKETEKALHSMFENKKIRGEWFDLEKKDLNFIRDAQQAIGTIDPSKETSQKKAYSNLREASRLEFLMQKGLPKKITRYIKNNSKKVKDEWLCILDSEVISKEVNKPIKQIGNTIDMLKKAGWFDIIDSSCSGVRILKIKPEIYGLAVSTIKTQSTNSPSYEAYYLMRGSRRALLDYIKKKVYYDDYFKGHIAEVETKEMMEVTKLTKDSCTSAFYRLRNAGWFSWVSASSSGNGSRIVKVDPKILFSLEELSTI